MKNLSIVFNIVLLALVGILFYLYFSLKNGSSTASSGSGDSKVVLSSGMQKPVRIAFVNTDTLNNDYLIMQDLKKDMQARQSVLQSEYDVKAKALQDEYMAYQQKVQSGNISQNDAEKQQKDMQQKKAVLDNMQAKLDEMVKEAQMKNQQIVDMIEKYIAQYNKKAHFDYVLAYAKGANILLVNDSLDITRQVLNALNAQYKDSLQKAGTKQH